MKDKIEILLLFLFTLLLCGAGVVGARRPHLYLRQMTVVECDAVDKTITLKDENKYLTINSEVLYNKGEEVTVVFDDGGTKVDSADDTIIKIK